MSKSCWISDSVDPDQLPHSVASDLGLHCLLRLVCPNTWEKYDKSVLINDMKVINRSCLQDL